MLERTFEDEVLRTPSLPDHAKDTDARGIPIEKVIKGLTYPIRVMDKTHPCNRPSLKLMHMST